MLTLRFFIFTSVIKWHADFKMPLRVPDPLEDYSDVRDDVRRFFWWMLETPRNFSPLYGQAWPCLLSGMSIVALYDELDLLQVVDRSRPLDRIMTRMFFLAKAFVLPAVVLHHRPLLYSIRSQSSHIEGPDVLVLCNEPSTMASVLRVLYENSEICTIDEYVEQREQERPRIRIITAEPIHLFLLLKSGHMSVESLLSVALVVCYDGPFAEQRCVMNRCIWYVSDDFQN